MIIYIHTILDNRIRSHRLWCKYPVIKIDGKTVKHRFALDVGASLSISRPFILSPSAGQVVEAAT